MARPRALLAAVFPWNHGGSEKHMEAEPVIESVAKEEVEASRSDSTMDGGTRGGWNRERKIMATKKRCDVGDDRMTQREEESVCETPPPLVFSTGAEINGDEEEEDDFGGNDGKLKLEDASDKREGLMKAATRFRATERGSCEVRLGFSLLGLIHSEAQIKRKYPLIKFRPRCRIY